MSKNDSNFEIERKRLKCDLQVAERTLENFVNEVIRCATVHGDSDEVKRILTDSSKLKELVNLSRKNAECEISV